MDQKKILESNLEEIKKGYSIDSDNGIYDCLICGEKFETGEIYPINGRFFEAHKAIDFHIKDHHGNRLESLLEFDKKYTGITDNQKNLLKDFYKGLSDKEIAKNNGVAEATIRHQRFVFREKARQAKAYLAIFELIEETLKKETNENYAPIHNSATMVDERYEVTTLEQQEIVETYFDSVEPLKLKLFPSKQKRKIVVLRKITSLFEKDKRYTEKELNDILKSVYEDFVTIRRYLIEYGFMQRSLDCKEYYMK
jgi:hypothetical protein